MNMSHLTLSTLRRCTRGGWEESVKTRLILKKEEPGAGQGEEKRAWPTYDPFPTPFFSLINLF